MARPIDCCDPDPAGTRLRVRVVPRARQSALVGVHGGALRVRVAAPPVEGKANAALAALLADALALRRRDVEVVAGARGRDKIVRIHGLDPATVAGRLPIRANGGG